MGWEIDKTTLKSSLRKMLILGLLSCLTPTVVSAADNDAVCLDCHDDMAESLANTLHDVTLPSSESHGLTCISCHGAGTEHIEDPSTENIVNPAALEGTESREVCSSCHTPHAELDNYGFDTHNDLQFNCSSCHEIHRGANAPLDRTAALCRNCHTDKKDSFSRRSQHPVEDQIVTCLSCHKFTKHADADIDYDLQRLCQDCHPEQGGPFPFEHEATYGHTLEGSGCLSCHSPHSSENDFLLKQKGRELCLQCHVGHEALSPLHASIAEVETCYACHSDIHGSYVSHKLLDPMLQFRLGSSQDCTQCHDLVE